MRRQKSRTVLLGLCFFFFNDTPTTEIYPLSLHDALPISPASASISADVGSETYTAEGRDQYNNSLGDVTGSTTFTVGGGSCTAATCTVTVAGAHTVTGTMLGAPGTASLTVTAGAAT